MVNFWTEPQFSIVFTWAGEPVVKCEHWATDYDLKINNWDRAIGSVSKYTFVYLVHLANTIYLKDCKFKMVTDEDVCSYRVKRPKFKCIKVLN